MTTPALGGLMHTHSPQTHSPLPLHTGDQPLLLALPGRQLASGSSITAAVNTGQLQVGP